MRISKIPDQILELLDNLAKYFATKNFWWVQWIPIWECLLKMMYFQNFKDIQIILNHSVSNYSFKGCVPCISAVLREAYVNLQNCVFQLNNQCYRISLEVICFWSPTFNKLLSLRELSCSQQSQKYWNCSLKIIRYLCNKPWSIASSVSHLLFKGKKKQILWCSSP